MRTQYMREYMRKRRQDPQFVKAEAAARAKPARREVVNRTRRHKYSTEKGRARYRKYLDSNRAYAKRRAPQVSLQNHAKRIEILTLYGMRCSCKGCGEDRWFNLSIDHRDNSGRLTRAGWKEAWREWKAGKGLNTERYRVLCIQCNFTRQAFSGLCPSHEIEGDVLAWLCPATMDLTPTSSGEIIQLSLL